MSESGNLFLIDKPYRYSSAKAVNFIKKILNVRKAGHSGTLDPLATGLLLVATGKRTKELHHFLNFDKEYTGVLVIGAKTQSFDMETEITEITSIENITIDDIKNATSKLTGEIEQIPPMFSAVKHKGKPLYKLARKNIEISRDIRKVTITEFSILKTELPEISFRIRCSKGTYIRTLVSDFGEILGVGAYLKELRRTCIGDYNINDAMTLEQFKKKYYTEETIKA